MTPSPATAAKLPAFRNDLRVRTGKEWFRLFRRYVDGDLLAHQQDRSNAAFVILTNPGLDSPFSGTGEGSPKTLRGGLSTPY